MSEFKVGARADDEMIVGKLWTELEEGERWRCIRCSDCCRKPWRVNLSWSEYDRMMDDPRFDDLVVDSVEVDDRTGLSHPYFTIEGKCPLLDDSSSLCTVYPDWPYTCACYPFLVMPDGRLMRDPTCRGFGHGDVIDNHKLRRRINMERVKAGMPRTGR